jgi:hypothetical protein
VGPRAGLGAAEERKISAGKAYLGCVQEKQISGSLSYRISIICRIYDTGKILFMGISKLSQYGSNSKFYFRWKSSISNSNNVCERVYGIYRLM